MEHDEDPYLRAHHCSGGLLDIALVNAAGFRMHGGAGMLDHQTGATCALLTGHTYALQGIVGSIPWTALVFFTLYLQLLGMTDAAASVLMALFLGSTGMLAAL